MRRKLPRRGRIIPVFFFTFVSGGLAGWWARSIADTSEPSALAAETSASSADRDVTLPSISGTTDTPAVSSPEESDAAPRSDQENVRLLQERRLVLPIDAAKVAAMAGQFEARRGDGTRGHEAVDIPAPRRAPIHAVDEGTIAKLFYSKQGGNTIYQFDPSGRLCYYYAHLDAYAAGLHEGQQISRRDVIGYVGTTGNAPPNAPHLHFAIFRLGSEKRWWQGTPIDPVLAFREQ
jgi:murein DD-endopeptidase MepM/ murein hydrolase activator NlpD